MRRMTLCLLLGIPCALVGAIFAIRSPADENDQPNYHVILFACEREGNPPRFSHTWATFVKSARNESEKPTLDESITISWMPASGVIPLVFAVRGRNYSLKESLDWARERNSRVAAWGPISIRKELYDLASQRKDVLESGELAFKMLDAPVRPDRGTNCIHAVSDMVPGEMLETGLARGEDATRMVADHLREYMIRAEFNDAEILDLLDIRWDSIEHHTLESSVRR
jgi:hypothetical protein